MRIVRVAVGMAVFLVAVGCGETVAGNALAPGERPATATSDRPGIPQDGPDLTGVDPCSLVPAESFRQYAAPDDPMHPVLTSGLNLTLTKCRISVTLAPPNEGVGDIDIDLQTIAPGADPATALKTFDLRERGGMTVALPGPDTPGGQPGKCQAVVLPGGDGLIFVSAGERNHTSRGDWCRLRDTAIDEVIEQLLTGRTRQYELPANSLVHGPEPCDLLTPEVLAAVGVAEKPISIGRLQGCVAGTGTDGRDGKVRISVNYYYTFRADTTVSPGENVQQIGNRTVVTTAVTDFFLGCDLDITHIPHPGGEPTHAEVVGVALMGVPEPEGCRRLQAAAPLIVARLPGM